MSTKGLLTDEAGEKRDQERDEPRSGVSAFWTMLLMMEMVFSFLVAERTAGGMAGGGAAHVSWAENFAQAGEHGRHKESCAWEKVKTWRGRKRLIYI